MGEIDVSAITVHVNRNGPHSKLQIEKSHIYIHKYLYATLPNMPIMHSIRAHYYRVAKVTYTIHTHDVHDYDNGILYNITLGVMLTCTVRKHL